MSTTRTLSTILLLGLFGMSSCKKAAVDPTKGFSQNVQNIISQDDIDKLRARGMTVNEGTQPPNIEGIYVSSPHELVSPYGSDDDYKTGDKFADLILRFSNQNSSDLTAKVETKTGNSTGAGLGGFLAGNGTKFTFFAEINSKSDKASSTEIRIFSGEITTTGIKDFYSTLLMKSKTDPDDDLIPVGASRIIKDGDGLASKRTSFRMGVGTDSNVKTESRK